MRSAERFIGSSFKSVMHFLLLNKVHYNMSFYIREGEENGKAYHFVTKEAMEAAICKNNFQICFLNISLF